MPEEPPPHEPGAGRFAAVRGWLPLLIPFALLALWIALRGAAAGYDEQFHVSATRQFHHALTHPRELAATLLDYDSASGPLTYVITGAWWGLTGGSVQVLRLLSIIVSALGVLVLYRIAREQRCRHPAVVAALLIFSPYFLMTSFMVMAQNYGLLFGLLGLLFALRGVTARREDLAMAVLMATLAALCRQIWLFLPAAIGLVWAVERVRDFLRARKSGAGFDYLRTLLEAAYVAAPFVVMGLLFLYWGGFANRANVTKFDTPEFHARYGWGGAPVVSVHVQPEFLAFILLIVGAHYGFSLLASGSNWRRGLAFAAAISPLFLLFPPELNLGSGLVAQAVHGAAGRLLPWAEAPAFFLLAFLGAAAVGAALLSAPDPDEPPAGLSAQGRLLVGAALFFFLLMNVLSSRLWERYMIEAVPFLVLALFGRAGGTPLRRWLFYAWVGLLAAVALAFVYYKCEVQFGRGVFF